MKKILAIIFLLRISICIFSQSISVNGIVDFYKKIDIDCYKEKISEGMAHFNTWLRDSLPTKTEMPSWYTPTDINLQGKEVIPLVALNFYNMKSFDEKESIYNHIIIDSTLSVIFIVLDDERKPIGITDVAGDRYSYIDFTNKNDANAYQRWDQKVKALLRASKREEPEALVYLYKLIGGLGHLHANNHGSYLQIEDIGIIPDILELSYLRTDKYNFVEDENILLPADFDQPCNKNFPDIKLGYWNKFI